MPAIAVADALRAKGANVSFIGTAERAEAELVPRAGYELDTLRVAGLSRTNPVKALASVGRAAAAIPSAVRVLKRRGVDAVMGGGGYVAGPVGLAAILSRRPLVLTEADSHFGLANRLLARRARRVCLALPIQGRDGPKYLVTGRPVPQAVIDADRGAARERFGIAPDARCVLVFGGSLGARTINDAALAAFAPNGGVTPDRDYHVLHIAGRRDYADALSQVENSDRYTLIEYEPNLGAVLAACDLVLGRAGGSVFELAAAGRPAILIPYPFATADHQRENAEWMVDGGAATLIDDAELTPERLAEVCAALLGDPTQLAAMSAASRSLAKPDAAGRIAAEILAACP